MEDKFKQIARIITRIASTLVLIPTLLWVYAPIIAGILFPMIWMFPIAFTSWWLLAFLGNRNWFNGWIELEQFTPGVITLVVFEFLIFLFGFVLFTWGIIYLAKIIFKKEGLAKGGPYKLIRHPQHLGLILMTFSLSLYVPWTTDAGIRIGEVLSWSLFSLILFLWSDYEERRLFRKFGEEYIQYRSKRGVFLPRIFNKAKERKNFYEITYWKRYLFTFLGYVGFIVIVFIVVSILSGPPFHVIQYPYDKWY